MQRNYNIIYLIIVPFLVGVITFYFIKDQQIFSDINTQIGYTLGFLASGILILSSFKKSKINFNKQVNRFDKSVDLAIILGSIISTCVLIFGIYGPFRPELFKTLNPFVVAFCIPLSIFYFLKIIIFKKDIYQNKEHKKFAKHVSTSINQRYDDIIFNWRPFVILESISFLLIISILILSQLFIIYDYIFENLGNNIILPILTVFILLSTLYFYGKLIKKFWLTSKGGMTICVFIICFFIALTVYFNLANKLT